MADTLGDDLIIGTERSGAEPGPTRRQAKHAIDTQQIPTFTLCGQWATLGSFFAARFTAKLHDTGGA